MDIQEIVSFLWIPIPMTDITLGNVLAAILILIVGYFVATIVVRYISHVMKKANMAKLLIGSVSRIAKLMFLLIVFLAAGSVLGIDGGSGLISISVVFGFVIGFAFQDMLGNLAAGFMIALTKPFTIGDYVDAAGVSGSAQHVGVSNTTLLTPDNKKTIIPNSKVWRDTITNYTAMDTRRVDLTVGISYDDDMGKAIQIALNVVKGHDKVLTDPAPLVACSG
jgi:small conductance mechanosensitive channel